MTDRILSDLRRMAQTYPTRGTQDAVIAAVDEIVRLRSDLAAARARVAELEDASQRLANELIVAEADLAAALANEQQLRHLLFLAHGNAEHYLYGDDGERFCNTCMIDFNADSPTEIERKIMAHWAKKQRIDAALREGEK